MITFRRQDRKIALLRKSVFCTGPSKVSHLQILALVICLFLAIKSAKSQEVKSGFDYNYSGKTQSFAAGIFQRMFVINQEKSSFFYPFFRSSLPKGKEQ